MIIGIDIGTQSAKAVVVDESLRICGSASVPYAVQYPKPGWAEQDPRLWEAALGPAIEAALKQAIDGGTVLGAPNQWEARLAEIICTRFASIDMVRFTNSGTEANLMALGAARAFTKRDRIMVFDGAYHGGVLYFSHGGTPVNVPFDIVYAPYNDTDGALAVIEANRGELAAVIMEPLQRCTPPQDGFLQGVRDLCSANGILLIYDEVVTGFRLAYGGAQEYYGVIPDLVAYGKALGGGYPIGAFGGRSDIMEMVNEHRIGGEDYVWMASTLGGNPISTAAANAALSVFRTPGTYDRLHGMGDYLRQGMRRILTSRQATAQVIGDGPLAQVVFSAEPAFNYRSTHKGDKAMARATMLGLFRRGVFLNPMGTKLYLSIAHDEAMINAFLDRFDDSLDEAALS